jgi:2-keto-4-pentenoate hydratase
VIQRQLGIGEPIFARAFDTGRFEAGAELSYGRFANLAVEGELAVRLGQDVSGPSVGAEGCQAAIASFFPVIELHHYVLRSPQPSVAELIASGGMHAGFVAAGHEAEVGLRGLESLSVCIDDQRLGTVSGAEVAELAVSSVRWLANQLAAHGLTLTKGQIVLTGSLLPLCPVKSGNNVTVEVVPFGRSSAAIIP